MYSSLQGWVSGLGFLDQMPVIANVFNLQILWYSVTGNLSAFRSLNISSVNFLMHWSSVT